MASKNVAKLNKVSRVDKNLKVKKSSTKPEILVQVTALLELNSALEEVNGKKDEVIESFQEKIDSLEFKLDELSKFKDLNVHMNVDKLDTVSISVQTDRIFSCHKCNYKADDVYEFDMHRWTEHEDEDELDTDNHKVHEEMEVSQHEHEHVEVNVTTTQGNFDCNFCHQTFGRKGDLMIHNKKEHSNKVSVCRHFLKGTCVIADEHCWFIHDKNITTFSTIGNMCNTCDKQFRSKSEAMKHKKLTHKELTEPCRHAASGVCMFGNEKCWFNHGNEHLEEQKAAEVKKELFEKMFDMMEKMTERIVLMENKM